jgi:UDP-glucose 4-epimerase
MPRQAKRVLVTGGAGFLGAHLVRSLLEAGCAVRVLDDFSTGRPARLAGLPIDLVRADVRDAAALRRACEGVVRAFHLAGVALGPAPRRAEVLHAEEVNVCGALALLHAASEASELRSGRVVIVGSGVVYGRANAHVLHEDIAPVPATAEGVQRISVEHYARLYRETHGVPAVVARLFRAYGPGESWEGDRVPLVPRLCRAALDGSAPVLVGNGRRPRDLIYVDDAVAALRAIGFDGQRGHAVYNVAAGEAASPLQLWHQLAELAGYRGDAPRPVHLPATELASAPPRASIARLRRDFPSLPTVTLREGLRRTLAHYRELVRHSQNGWFTPAVPTLDPFAEVIELDAADLECSDELEAARGS